MSGSHLRSSVVVLALVACACSATARGIGAAPGPARQVSVTADMVYGHKDGLALTFDVHRAAQPNGAGVIAIVSGGWQSSVEMSRQIVDGYLSPLLNEKGFTVFAVRHGSSPRYPMSAIVADLRRAVRFIRQHAGEYGVDPNRMGVYGGSAGGQLALLLGTTADTGDPSASDTVLKESSRVAAVVAYFPVTGSLSMGDGAEPTGIRGHKADGCRSGGVLTHSLRLARRCSLAHRAWRRRHPRPDRRGGDDARDADEGGRARVVHPHRRRGARVRRRRSRARQRRNGAMVRAASRARGEVDLGVATVNDSPCPR